MSTCVSPDMTVTLTDHDTELADLESIDLAWREHLEVQRLKAEAALRNLLDPYPGG